MDYPSGLGTEVGPIEHISFGRCPFANMLAENQREMAPSITLRLQRMVTVEKETYLMYESFFCDNLACVASLERLKRLEESISELKAGLHFVPERVQSRDYVQKGLLQRRDSEPIGSGKNRKELREKIRKVELLEEGVWNVQVYKDDDVQRYDNSGVFLTTIRIKRLRQQVIRTLGFLGWWKFRFLEISDPIEQSLFRKSLLTRKERLGRFNPCDILEVTVGDEWDIVAIPA